MGNKEIRLDQQLEDLLQTVPKDVLKIVNVGIKALTESDIVANAVKVGDKAPEFSLSNHKGDTVTLSKVLETGPVVLTWYRGAWCPFCNMQLRNLQRLLPEFNSYGANLLALSPEKPDGSLSVKEKNDLEFEVLSDFDNVVAKKYGIVFKLSEELSHHYKATFGIDLESYNGTLSDELPLAATYLIDQQGVVRYACLSTDHTKRAEPSDIINVLSKIISTSKGDLTLP